MEADRIGLEVMAAVAARRGSEVPDAGTRTALAPRDGAFTRMDAQDIFGAICPAKGTKVPVPWSSALVATADAMLRQEDLIEESVAAVDPCRCPCRRA